MSGNQSIALVSAGASGIGRTIADALWALSYQVVVLDINREFLRDYAENYGDDRAIFCDVADSVAVDKVMADLLPSLSRVDLLVNNAGITRDNILMRMKDEEWSQVIDTNLNSVYRLSKACLRGMTKARWGRIITISSVVGSMGNAGQANYAATKAGVEGFTRALAKELGSRSITVNAVAPGFIDTDMTRELSEDNRTLMLQQIPLGRLGEAAEIGAIVGFLAGNSAGYITGETIHVNGGMYMG